MSVYNLLSNINPRNYRYITIDILIRDHHGYASRYDIELAFDALSDMACWEEGSVIVDGMGRHLRDVCKGDAIPEFIDDRYGNQFEIQPEHLKVALFNTQWEGKNVC